MKDHLGKEKKEGNKLRSTMLRIYQMKKEIVSFIAIAAVIMSALLPMAFAVATTAKVPTDISGNWAQSQIENMIVRGVINDYPDGTFKPDNPITRAEFITMINRAFNFTATAPNSYSDVSSSDWFAAEVAKAKAAGYISGFGEGTINPNKPISREEVATIIAKLKNLQLDAAAADKFTDVTASKGAIGAVVNANIMEGYSDGTFKPASPITRAEAVVTLGKALGGTPTDNSTSKATIDTPAIVGVTAPVIVGVTAPVTGATPVSTLVPVNLGMAGNYAILAKTGISSVPSSVINGNIGVSPVAATYITGFSLIADSTNVFSTSTQVNGKVFAANYAPPTPSNLTTAVRNMETAYVDAAGRSANYTELYAGDISGQTLTAGVYKWGTGVLINKDVTLNGGVNDVWIFQIAKGITQASSTKIILTGGAQAKNIFWQAAETVAIGTGAHFEGIILGKTNISLAKNASINGRLLAQTAVTLDYSTVNN